VGCRHRQAVAMVVGCRHRHRLEPAHLAAMVVGCRHRQAVAMVVGCLHRLALVRPAATDQRLM